MSLILASPAALNQPGKPPSNAKSRSDEQEPNKLLSFGEVLSRSQAPAGEITEKTAGKVAAPALARRQAGDPKTDPADLLNAMVLSFVPLESRVAKAMPSDGAVAAPDTTVAAAATAPLTGLSVSLATDRSMAATEVKEVNTLAGAQTVLAPALAPASQKGAGPAMLQARLSPVNASSDLQLDPGKIAAQASVPNTVASDQLSKRDDRAANKPGAISAASADLKPAATPAAMPTAIPTATHGTAKVAASAATPGAEAAAMAISGSQAPAAEPLSASAALPINPVLAAALSPAGVASSNTPAAVSTPSLSPEVGSSEWGKALGQQVVQMGKAGHQVAELQLNPPGLGPLKVTLSMNDNQIQALFVSAHSSVRAAVEAALPQLRATLADSGISLGNTSVSAGSQQQQTAFAHSQNGQPDQRSFRSNSRVDMATLSARAVTEPLRHSNGSTVDTYV